MPKRRVLGENFIREPFFLILYDVVLDHIFRIGCPLCYDIVSIVSFSGKSQEQERIVYKLVTIKKGKEVPQMFADDQRAWRQNQIHPVS